MDQNRFKVLPLTIIALLGVGVNSVVFGDELPEITFSLIGDKVISLESSNKLVRATVDIENYNPHDGYYFMRVVNLSTNHIFKESEFIPRYIGEQRWGTQIAYMIPDDGTEQVAGHYEIQIYSESGTSTANIPFSIVSQNFPLSSLNEEIEFLVSGNTTGSTGLTGSTGATGSTGLTGSTKSTEENIEEKSPLPEWVRNVFLWYGEEKISENDLLVTLEFLINQKIITVNSE